MCTGRPERPSSGFATLPTQGCCQRDICHPQWSRWYVLKCPTHPGSQMWAMWKSCRGSTPWIGTTLGGWPSHYCCYPNSPDLAGFHVVHVFFFFLLFFTNFCLPEIVQPPSRSTWRLSTTPRILTSSQKSSSTSVSFAALVFCWGNWKTGASFELH